MYGDHDDAAEMDQEMTPPKENKSSDSDDDHRVTLENNDAAKEESDTASAAKEADARTSHEGMEGERAREGNQHHDIDGDSLPAPPSAQPKLAKPKSQVELRKKWFVPWSLRATLSDSNLHELNASIEQFQVEIFGSSGAYSVAACLQDPRMAVFFEKDEEEVTGAKSVAVHGIRKDDFESDLHKQTLAVCNVAKARITQVIDSLILLLLLTHSCVVL